MSYRNPTQYIDRSLGKDVQQLQNTITSSFRSFGESYAKRQKEAAAIVKKETARRTKLTTDLEAKKLTLNKGFADLKENNNSYDFQKILGNELKVYNEYATSLINNTIDDPKEIARRKHRMAEIEGLPGSIKTDLGVIGSYSEGMGEKMNANGTFGGYYLGGKAQGLEYMQVLADNLEGARDVALQWDNEKGGYNISYVNTPEGGEPISINSRDLRAGEVGAKELVATIPDPTENQTAALKASGLYTKIRGEDGKEEEVLDKSYLQEEETIDDPNVKGGKLRVQRVDKNKFINNPQVVQAAKAYIDGLDPDDREALNNGIFAVQKENLLKKDSPEFYIPSYGDDEETNKANDALVLKNYIQYQADRIPSEKVLEEIKPEKPIEDKKPSAAQLKKAKDAEAIAGNFAQVIGDGKDLEDSLKKANITTNRVITDTGDENGKVLGYIAKKGDKEYRFMTGDSEREKVKKLLEFDGKLSASEIIENLDKLFPLGSKDPLNPNI
jgi:hypothetical protein